MKLLNFLKNTFSRSLLQFCLAVFCLYAFAASGEGISFSEKYFEKIVDEELVGGGNSTVKINLLWNGVDPAQFDDLTEIDISIGGFQLNAILGLDDAYEEGKTSVKFDDRDGDGNGSRFDISWNTQAFTISGWTRSTNENPGSENYFGAKNSYPNGPIQDSYEASITFGAFKMTKTVIVSGKNTVTQQTVNDEVFTKNNVQISGLADFLPTDITPPTVSITSPVANGRILTPLITGKASDGRGVADVLYQIGDYNFVRATGTTNWSATPNLEPGTNIIRVKSVDLSGNESPIVTRTFFYVVTSPLAVKVVGEGRTSLTNGQLLELGKNYTITAIPDASSLFLEWLGDNFNSGEPTARFKMIPAFSNPDSPLRANFVSNPLALAKGIFNGFFTNPYRITAADAGYLSINLKDSVVYSGTIYSEGSRYPISGWFDSAGRTDKIILRRGKPPLEIHLELDFAGKLFGTITINDEVSLVKAELVKSTTNSANMKYTVLIPPGLVPETAPGGYGFGCASVDQNNRLNFRGVLADGTPVNQSTMISRTGRWPLFAPLYRGKGVLLGWLSFTNEPSRDIHGAVVTWTKAAGVNGKFYTDGFSIAGEVIGSEYSSPPFNTNWATSLVEINGGNLTAGISNSVSLGANNKLTVASTNNSTLSLVASSGLLIGKFADPATRKTVLLKGVLLQKQLLGGGFFLGTNQSGSFLLQPATE